MIGSELKQRRKELKWSHERLSSLTGISRPTIANIEKGNTNINLDKLIKISNALGKKVRIVLV